PPANEWVLQIDNVSKKFDIYLNDRARVLEFFGNRKHHSEHWALRDVSFSVQRGQSFGVIGANGAGKSTLLKLMAGISLPTEGEIRVRSEISTLLDLGLGFHQSFSGRENIRMNCTLLGMSKQETQAYIPKIIEFAELGDFIDFPVRTFSAGMILRLGFAIAAHAPADILLIDEVLTVGDQYFQRKCIKKIEEFLAQGRTIVLVSHDLHSIRSLCDTALWLENGGVRELGNARTVVDRYLDVEREKTTTGHRISGPFIGSTQRPKIPLPQNYAATQEDPQLKQALIEATYVPDAKDAFTPEETTPFDVTDGDQAVVQGSGEIRFLKVQILDKDARPRERFHTGEDLIVAVTFRTTEPVERPIFGVAIFRSDNVYIHGPNTRFDKVLDQDYNGIYTFFIRWKSIPLLTGHYRLSIAVFDKNHLKPHIWHNQLYDLEIVADIEDHGLVILEHDWGMITHYEE
ncbi:MAG: ABC transporter ATP-binding protein, partial [Myxococcota bacterium]|nr:ABC transporter ATP-binding protein [Myxococcota bacterium]